VLRFCNINPLARWIASMWRDIFGFTGTILAVVNGLIAFGIALLPSRRSVYRLRLGVVALLLGAFAVGATFYIKFRTYIQIERQQSDRGDIHKRLDAFVAEGRQLLAQIKDPKVELPAAAADTWAQRAEIYLGEKVGSDAIPRFRKPAGELYGTDETVAVPRQAYWRAVRDRIVNLDEINAGLAEERPR
jgi:type IV secretory pathway VirB2 component (pilin)